jgi:hypothetical protein
VGTAWGDALTRSQGLAINIETSTKYDESLHEILKRVCGVVKATNRVVE